MQFFPYKNYFLIRDFSEIQRKSFCEFLENGLIHELANMNPIKNSNTGFEVRFFPEKYKLTTPNWTVRESILKGKTYACRIYVPAQFNNQFARQRSKTISKHILAFHTSRRHKKMQSKIQWILLGDLPLMTKRGHFISNGSPRVIVNQVVRSPGIYYHCLVEDTKLKVVKTFYADIIPFRGTWLRLETDKKERIWARMKRIPKISIVVFLQALGYNLHTIQANIEFSELLQESYLKFHPSNTQQARKRLILEMRYDKLKKQARAENLELDHPQILKEYQAIQENTTLEEGVKFLTRKLGNPQTYQLGKLGRFRLNKKLGNKVSFFLESLTPYDLLLATNELLKRMAGFGSFDDIDNLKNRRVRTCGELIQSQWANGLLRLEKLIEEKLGTTNIKTTLPHLITTKPINGAFREFFGSNPLCQYMDQTNPLAEITHKRRISSLGPGGVSRDTAGMAVRGIHPTYYGRICPIETPEGRNAGLVNSVTIYARLNPLGFLETPFLKVCQSQVQITMTPKFLCAEKEEVFKIAPGDLQYSRLHFLHKTLVPMKLADEFGKRLPTQVEYIGLSPLQMISIGTSLIPFLEHDDANRALMGSNMQRQALPLMIPERAIVGTGLEARVIADSGHSTQAKNSGYVSYSSGGSIVVQSACKQNPLVFAGSFFF